MAKTDINIENYKDLTGLKKKLFQIFQALVTRIVALEERPIGTDNGPTNLDDIVPVGSIIAFPGPVASIPNKWLLCDGSELSRTAYPQLFGVIGTTYGAGDGSTTFNLPESRGEFIRGLDNGRGIDVGRTLGSFQGGSVGPHDHGFFAVSQDNSSGSWEFIVTNTTGSATANTGAIKTNGNGIGSETRPRNLAQNFIIKVDVDTRPAPIAYEVPDGSIVEAKLGTNAVTYDKSAIFPLGGNRTVRYYRSTNFNVADNGTVTVTFDTPDFGVNDYIVRSGNQYICQADGIYQINASLFWESLSNITYARTDLLILINGSLRKRHRTVSDRGDSHTNEATLILKLAQGDIIQVQANHNVTPNATRTVGGLQDVTYLNLTYLGA